jgi:hypothetical protein
LLVSSQITDAVAITLFLEKLEERFRELILENLERHPPALAAGVVQDPGTRTWTLKEVINEAKRMVQRHTVNSEFLDNDLPRVSGSTGHSMTTRVFKREEKDTATMSEAIKSFVVNMVSEIEERTFKKVSLIHEETQKKMNELDSFYKSLPGRLPGAPDSQTMPPSQVRFRPLTQTDLCYYCLDAGHRIDTCPYRQAHIASGLLKVVGNRDCYSDGQPCYAIGNKSRQQMIEESIGKTGAAQSNS